MGKEEIPWALLILALMFLAGFSLRNWVEETECERVFNVYDCEYEWYPVYGEEIPEEELMP